VIPRGPRLPVAPTHERLSLAQVKGLAWFSLPVGMARVLKRREAPSQQTIIALEARRLITAATQVAELTREGQAACEKAREKAEGAPGRRSEEAFHG
jgi:hypothetical protein